MASQIRLPDEPTHEDLVEAMERMDAGHRLAFPKLFDRFDGLGADPEPEPAVEIDADVVYIIGAELSDGREAILNAGRCLPLAGNQDIHLRLNALVDEVDDLASILAERRAS